MWVDWETQPCDDELTLIRRHMDICTASSVTVIRDSSVNWQLQALTLANECFSMKPELLINDTLFDETILSL